MSLPVRVLNPHEAARHWSSCALTRPGLSSCSSAARAGGGGGVGPGKPTLATSAANHALTYDDRLTLKLDVGGAVREVTQTGYGGVVDFGMVNGQRVTLDLTAFCAKPEVKCPAKRSG